VTEPLVQEVAERLRQAPKYRQIHLDTITDVVEQERPRSSSTADLERRSRLRLHRVVADYLLTARPGRLLRGLDEAASDGPEALRGWCRQALARHVSTQERLADLDQLYPTLFELSGPVRSVADLACALNPLTLPWLRSVSDVRYTGYDLNLAYVEVGETFLRAVYPDSRVLHLDVLVRPELVQADAAWLLKTFHCVEDRCAGAALSLVDQLETAVVVVSFPLRTLSGRVAPFTPVYLERLTALAQTRGWGVREASLQAERFLALVKKPVKGS